MTMEFEHLQWADAGSTQIYGTIAGGEVILINAQPGLTHYDNIVASGAPIEPYVPSSPPPQTQLMYDHENRLRALEGQPPLTMEDVLTKLMGGKPA